MYFVGNKSFNNLFDAIDLCKSGSIEDVVTDENGTILMKHEEFPIEDIFGLIIAKTTLYYQRNIYDNDMRDGS